MTAQFMPCPKQGPKTPKPKKRMPRVRAAGPRKNRSRLISPEFLEFIRRMPCACGCGCQERSHPHHLIARKWADADRNDFTCVPLCHRCHTEAHTFDMAKFSDVHGVNLWAINRNMVAAYQNTGRQVPEAGHVYRSKLGENHE